MAKGNGTTERESARDGVPLQLFICEYLLAALPPGHPVLLGLALLSRSELLLLVHLDLVTHSIVLVFLITCLLVNTGTRALTLDPVVAGSLKATIAHGPDFRAEGLGEVAVVRNHEHTTFEVLQRFDKRGERLTIEVV
jgi:hypothetical protein